jgi:predicted Fe-Mo cluster-binding NifX family protein
MGFVIRNFECRVATVDSTRKNRGGEDMKIAVSSNGNHLESQIDPRFGRCAYFLIVNQDDMNFEAFNNESIALGGGAGIQAAQFVASKGAKAILTGHQHAGSHI